MKMEMQVVNQIKSKQSRSEKKSREAMFKLRMKCIPGVSRVTVKKNKNILFVIWKSPACEAKIENLNIQLQSQAAEQFKTPDLNNVISKSKPSALAQDVDETGVSRPKAVKALKVADGDIVSAIMESTN